MTKGQKIIQDRIHYLMTKQIDRLVEEQCHPELIFLGFHQTCRGKDEMRIAFENFVKDEIESIKVHQVVESEDQVFLKGTIVRASGIMVMSEAFFLKDGLIYRQFSHEKTLEV